MTENTYPRLGAWCQDDMGRRMQATVCGEQHGFPNARPFQGAIAEPGLDSWNPLETRSRRAPEDWSGPYDGLVAGETGNSERPSHSTDWNGPAIAMDRED